MGRLGDHVFYRYVCQVTSERESSAMGKVVFVSRHRHKVSQAFNVRMRMRGSCAVVGGHARTQDAMSDDLRVGFVWCELMMDAQCLVSAVFLQF